MTSAQIKTESILADINLKNLPPKRKQEIYSKLLQHFTHFVVVSTLSYLTEEQFIKFKQHLRGSNEEIAALCAEVPGLAEFLETKLEQEYSLLKSFIKTNA